MRWLDELFQLPQQNITDKHDITAPLVMHLKTSSKYSTFIAVCKLLDRSKVKEGIGLHNVGGTTEKVPFHVSL